MRIQINGRRRDIGLGNCATSVRTARLEAAAIKKLAASGVDPLEERRKVEIVVPTYEAAAKMAHAELVRGWKNGKQSKQWLSDVVRQHAIALAQSHYADFGPTLAAEYLGDCHDVRISHESLRKLIIDAGLWKDRQARRPRPYQPRYRRDCRGELVQIDGSKHW